MRSSSEMASSLKQMGEFSTGVMAMMVNSLPRTESTGASASSLALYTAPDAVGLAGHEVEVHIHVHIVERGRIGIAGQQIHQRSHMRVAE